jgi:hypothetical protein
MHYHSNFGGFSRKYCSSVPAVSHSGLKKRKFCYEFLCMRVAI